MATTVDLEQLARVFGRRGERVVLVLPTGGPVVLVPLSEYEELVSPGRSGTRPAQTAAGQVPRRNPARPLAQKPVQPQVAPTEALEAVDPLQGSLSDDDQYFPEPLE
jgi:hypothetical protein